MPDTPTAPSTSSPTPTSTPASTPATEPEKVLCPYCKRTATNGIKCKGICVAENDY